MSKLPRISEAEWEVMQVVWESHPVTANEIVRRLAPKTRWSHRTIRSMLNRLVKKGALTFKAEGNRYLYRPRVKKETCVRKELQSFIDRVFCGDPASVLVQFVQNTKFSPDELEELKRILSEKSEETEG